MNGQSFEHVNHAKALDILRASTHLSITVKSNLLGGSNRLFKTRIDHKKISTLTIDYLFYSFQGNASNAR